MRRAVRRGAALTVVGLMSALVVAAGVAGARSGSGPAAPVVSDQRQQEITAAAAEFGVPGPLLLALAGALSGFGATTDPAVDGGHGLFRLTDRPAGLDGRGGTPDTRGARMRAAAGADPAAGTLPAAAALAGRTTAQVRNLPAEGARAAAALLRRYVLDATGGRLPTALTGWYGAVARFGTGDAMTGRAVADDVYALLRTGVPATVVAGQRFSVPARADAALPRARAAAAGGDCPAMLSCRLVPTAGAVPAGRGAARWVVVSTAPAGYTATIAAAQRAGARWSPHYVVRAADGAVTQTVRLRDVAWHTGNPTADAGSVGIAVEADPGPAAYLALARLLRWLAARGLPLDRQHVLGADEVAGAPVTLQPGFDWAQVLARAGAPLRAQAFRADRVAVVVAPDLVLRDGPGGAALPERPAVGRALAVAERRAGWTAVWYGGRAAWFADPDGSRTLPGDLSRLTPVPGRSGTPVYAAAGTGALLGRLPSGQSAVLLDPTAVDGEWLAVGYGRQVGYLRAAEVGLAL